MSNSLYSPLERIGATEAVVQRLERLIVENRLRPGEVLPAERELAEGFGVGWNVVREALRILGEKGLVHVIAGRGTFVAEPNTSRLTESLRLLVRHGRFSLDELSDVRLLIEPELAALAAGNATPDNTRALRERLQFMHGRWPSGPDGRRLDYLFAGDGTTADLLYLRPTDGWHVLHNEDTGLAATMTWDTGLFPWVWLWQECRDENRYPWLGRYHIVGVEPFTSYPSMGLSEALRRGTALRLSPERARHDHAHRGDRASGPLGPRRGRRRRRGIGSSRGRRREWLLTAVASQEDRSS